MDNQRDIDKDIDIAKLGLFNADHYLVFIYKKTQALINALYMVTNLYPEAEPLKWSIRTKAVSLLEDILSLPIKTFSERKNALGRFTAKVLEIVSLCDISSASTLMSSMNFQILEREFKQLINLIEKHEEPYRQGSNFILDKKLFNIPAIPERIKDKGQLKDLSRTSVRDNGERQKAIMDTLKDKKELSIKEIALALPELSDKTLQRELQKLVSAGVVKKMGERRWSRYSVI